MKKSLFLASLSIFTSFISLTISGCNFNTSLKEETIEILYDSDYGNIQLDKYSGKVNEVINGIVNCKAGYKVEYLLFNNEFISVFEDNTFNIKINSTNNCLRANFIKVIPSNYGQITFLNKNNYIENKKIESLNDCSLIYNLDISNLTSYNSFYSSKERNIILGSNESTSLIKFNFNETKYIKSFSINCKNSGNYTSSLKINYGSLNNLLDITTSYMNTFTSKNVHTIECDEFSIEIEKNYGIELSKISFEFGEKEVFEANIVDKYNETINILPNETIDILNYVNFDPFNLEDRRIILECEDKDLNINGTLISSSIEKKYKLNAYLAINNTKFITLDINVNSNLINPGTIRLNKHNNSLNIKDVKDNLGIKTLPTTGNLNLVAVPVQFSDLTSKWDENKLKVLDDVLNSNSLDVYESLSSYYLKSSYNQLNIHVDIADVIIPSFSSSTYLEKNDNYAGETFYLINKIYTSIAINGTKLSSLVDNYDLDKDKRIDGIYFVYNEFDMSKVDTNRFWAYTYWYIDTNCGYYNSNIPLATFCSLAGAFNERSKLATYDSHTLIHETGHMLGAEDYYSYDGESMGYSGGLDMMDLNIGDHSAFTKYLFSWIKPYLLDINYSNKTLTVTLNKFEETGDCLIIPSSTFNNSPFGEYLIFEYYTNDNLNYFDSINDYYEGIYMYSDKGIRVFHVNSTLIKYTSYSSSFYSKDEYKLDTNAYYSSYAYSNTPSSSYEKNVPLYQLVSRKNEKLYGKRYATNDDLFIVNDVINNTTISSTLKNNKFYDGSEFNFEIVVESLDENEAILKITLL